jgi:hypothetical protein
MSLNNSAEQKARVMDTEKARVRVWEKKIKVKEDEKLKNNVFNLCKNPYNAKTLFIPHFFLPSRLPRNFPISLPFNKHKKKNFSEMNSQQSNSNALVDVKNYIYRFKPEYEDEVVSLTSSSSEYFNKWFEEVACCHANWIVKTSYGFRGKPLPPGAIAK